MSAIKTQSIDGKAAAADLRAKIAAGVAELKKNHGLTPGLAVVLVGDNPASAIYVRNKAKATRAVGMESFSHRLPVQTSQQALLDLIKQLNKDPKVHGILVQMPLPPHLDSFAVLEAVDPAKDVDGFHPVNAGLLAVGRPVLVPCTPLGCMMLLRKALGPLTGKKAVVVGRSIIVGKPMAQLLLAADCTVTVVHSHTHNAADEVRQGDIVVAAAGQPEMIRGSWLKPGCTVIDVGINRRTTPEGSLLVGDVAWAEAQGVAGAITPVPGGVGPMTIACLLLNTLHAACRQAELPLPMEAAS